MLYTVPLGCSAFYLYCYCKFDRDLFGSRFFILGISSVIIKIERKSRGNTHAFAILTGLPVAIVVHLFSHTSFTTQI